ncbi:MAG: major capsid protein [Microviridae sp.]|nr:MAG: major capsid protein [Microviridae sp.]
MEMRITEQTIERAAPVPRSMRMDRWRGLTSCKAGVIVPLAYFPLLREDAISGTVNVSVRMQETVLPLLNGVRCKVMAHLFANSADERFSSLEELNASYRNEPNFAGRPTVPFVDQAVYNGTSEIHKTLGVHQVVGSQINRVLFTAYNTIVNTRRQTRSKHLPSRALTDNTLAQAFWHDPNRWEIVPDFDVAMIEGLVPLTGEAPVSGIGIDTRMAQVPGALTVKETGYQDVGTSSWNKGILITGAQSAAVYGKGSTAADFWPEIYAEMGGVSLSLQNLHMVEKTQTFARLRDQYSGNNPAYIIDLLMSGISVPPSQLRDPVLLGTAVGMFGMQERHASDYANLDKSLTTGTLSLSVPIRVPPINPGGIVLVTMEIVPESLPELGADPFLEVLNPGQYPDYVDDTLDPEKISVVPNREIDVFHSSPNGVFGYQRLNAKWNRDFARIGGKYIDGATPSISEERYRFWQVRPTDPDLTEDFYLCPAPFPHDVFADSEADPFEVTTLANMTISGLTVFGPRLEEDRDSFEQTAAGVDTGRVDQSATTATIEAPIVETDDVKAVEPDPSKTKGE